MIHPVPAEAEKSKRREVKHKVVCLILIYFIINNAFYKNEHITHSYELAFKEALNMNM